MYYIMKVQFLLHQDSVVWYSITTCLSLRFTTISWLSRCNCKKLIFLSTGPVSFNPWISRVKRKNTQNLHIFVSQKILQHCFDGYLKNAKKDVIDTHKIACQPQCLKITEKFLIFLTEFSSCLGMWISSTSIIWWRLWRFWRPRSTTKARYATTWW